MLFNALWAGFDIALLWLGGKYELRMLRGCVITSLLILAYTIYFWNIAEHLRPILATFVAGAFTLGLVVHFEAARRGQHIRVSPATATVRAEPHKSD